MILVTFRIGQSPTVTDSLHRRQQMGLLDQLHPRGAVLAAKMLRIRLMPPVATFLGGLFHVFGQHEIPVVEQTGLSRSVRDSPADDSPVRRSASNDRSVLSSGSGAKKW